MPGFLNVRFLRSRFGRRLLLMFVVCAILPLAVLAALSFQHVTKQLNEQSRARLHQATRAMGVAIYERLTFLDAELRRLDPEQLLENAGTVAPAELGDQFDHWFAGLTIVTRFGTPVPIAGFIDTLPVLDQSGLQHLRLGQTLLTAVNIPGEPARIYMVRRMSPGRVGGMMIARLNSEALWGLTRQSLVSATMQLTILDDANRVVFHSIKAPAAFEEPDLLAMSQASTGTFHWEVAGEPSTATWWSIFLKSAFHTPRWTLVVSEAQADVLAPMVNFRRNFILLLLLCLWIVLLMGVRQIRRGLGPLRALLIGTRRIAARDFDSRVTIRSKDEFEELGTAFNAMATRLGRQFSALRTGAEIDRAILSAMDTTHIIDTVLSRMHEMYPCDVVTVTLADPDKVDVAATFIRGGGSLAQREEVECRLTTEDRVFLEKNSRMIVLLPEEGKSPAGYLKLALESGAGSFVILPLMVKGQLAGVITLGHGPERATSPDDLEHARGLADQVAVALTNVRMMDQVRFLAYYDSLTHLPNRVLNRQRLELALARAQRERQKVAVFFLDLDHFGRINDTLGHDLGDQLVRDVGTRISSCCRVTDSVGLRTPENKTSVARLGGDEFTVILPDLDEPQSAAKVAQRLLQTFSEPFLLGGQEVFVTASIGIAIYPDDGNDIEGLLKNADSAMYYAKEQGRNNFQMYSRSMNETALARLTLENELRRSVERNEFIMHYQPVADLTTGSIVGMEALVRWKHPRLGLVSPLSFIPLAEDSGLIGPLGEWILRSACAQNRAWQDAGLPPIRVAVNLSSRQFRQRDLIDMVRRVLQETRLDPRWLTLELTESILMQNADDNIATLNAFKAMGLRLSIDDFGTGYSSLSYLKHFPLDTLKVDQSFVKDIPHSPENAAITGAIVAMAHAMGLNVIAEGVENPEQLSFLTRVGCDEVQGFLFSRPVPAEAFGTMLREGYALSSIQSSTGLKKLLKIRRA